MGGYNTAANPAFAFQSGGIVTSPPLGMIGEHGPEAVVPLQNGAIPIHVGGGGHTFNFFIHAIDTQGMEEALSKHAGFINAMVYDANGVRRP